MTRIAVPLRMTYAEYIRRQNPSHPPTLTPAPKARAMRINHTMIMCRTVCVWLPSGLVPKVRAGSPCGRGKEQWGNYE